MNIYCCCVVYHNRELDHLEGIEDQYVTILPPSPSHFKSQHNVHSTASLLRRSASVPDILNSNDNNNTADISDTNITTGSMTSLYDESEAEEPLKPPAPPTSKNKFEGKERRSSFSEDYPTLQRNTVLQETRKAHRGYFASPQVTSSTFKVRPVDDIQLNTSPPAVDRAIHTINTGGSPTQSESSVGIVNVLQQSNITSPISPLSQYSSNSYTRSPQAIEPLHSSSSVPVKQFASRLVHQKSLPDYALSQPNSVPDNSFVYPIPPQKPIFSFGNSSPTNKQITSNLSRPARQMGRHQNSLPDLMAFPGPLTTTNPRVPANEKDRFSPPVVKRFTKAHQRCKSLSDLMPAAPVNNPDHQRKLHKALGGTRPQSMAAQQVK